MAYEHKDGSGALFKNDKGDNDKRPDYKGDVMIDGTLYDIAAWLRESQAGTKYLSLKVDKKNAEQTTAASTIDADDEIPF